MDVGKSLTFMFDDPRWVTKFLVGTLVLIISTLLAPFLIGIVGFFIVGGYGLDVLRNVRRREAYPMPEWQDHWGHWLAQGFRLAVALIIWALPLILAMIPLVALGAVAGDQEADFLAVSILTCAGCLAVIWTIVIALASPGIYVRIAESESLGSGLHVGEILAFTRQHLSDVLIAIIVYFLASLVVGLVASMVGLILCIVGTFITAPFGQLISTLIQSHLYGQVGLEGRQAPQPATQPAIVPPAEAPAEVSADPSSESAESRPDSVPAEPSEPSGDPEQSD